MNTRVEGAFKPLRDGVLVRNMDLGDIKPPGGIIAALIHLSQPTRPSMNSDAVFCLKKKKKTKKNMMITTPCTCKSTQLAADDHNTCIT